MKTKAQVLIIGLWILVILAMLAIGIGHRVSIALRLSRYQKMGLKAAYLAKAGINTAIKEIEKDDPNTDSLKDKWADNQEKFEKISLGQNKDEFATVSYVKDEESKININTAPKELLIELLDWAKATNPSELANNICAWRGDAAAQIPDYQILGYSNKGEKLSNTEELILVKGVTEDIYNAIKEFVTTYPAEGESKININTALDVILEIIMNTFVKKLEARNIPIENPQGVLQAIIAYRNTEGGIFTETNLASSLENLSNEQKNILNDPVDGLQNKISVKSNYFRIESIGKVDNLKLKHTIECVFDRQSKKTVFWHEN